MNEETTTPMPVENRQGLKPATSLLSQAYDQYTNNYKVLVPIMLLGGIGLYLQTILTSISSGNRNAIDGSVFAALTMLAGLIYLVGMIWAFAALLNKVHKLDEPMTLKQAFMSAKPLIVPLIVVGFLAGLFSLIGFLLLVIPGIIVAVWLSFSYYIVVNENKTGMEALKASKAYVQGYWWPVFGRLILVVIIVAVLSGVFSTIFGFFDKNLGALVNGIISLALAPFVLLYQYNLYLDVKRVKGGTPSEVVAEPSAPTVAA
jgi:hypothetical protein